MSTALDCSCAEHIWSSQSIYGLCTWICCSKHLSLLTQKQPPAPRGCARARSLASPGAPTRFPPRTFSQHGALSPRGARLRPRAPHHRRAARALLLGAALARAEPQLIHHRLVVHEPHAPRLRARPAPLTRPPPRRLRGRPLGPGSAGGVCVWGGLNIVLGVSD